jgi:hypothetical protein
MARSIANAIATCAALCLFVLWLAGIVLAKGVWPTIFASGMPFYAWYLVVERVMLYLGIA